MSKDSSSISFTAYYTGEVWRQQGLSSPIFTNPTGQVLYQLGRPAEAMARLLAGTSIGITLLQRHQIIDAVVKQAIEQHGVSQIVEIAYANDRRVVVMIDEAQQLSIETLEQVRLLTNLETNKDKLMQIILVGQPELNEMLASKHLRQLSQRIKSRYHLGELDLQQLGAYIKNRLRVAGCDRELFTKKAIKKIFNYTEGVPRLINVLCDRCLMGAYATDRAIIDQQVVNQAAKEVFGNDRVDVGSGAMKWVSFAVVVVGLLFALVWGAMQYQPQWFSKFGLTSSAQATQSSQNQP